MSTYSFVAVSYYLFPDEAVALDEHVNEISQKLASNTITLPRVLELLGSDSVPDNFGEGRFQIWKDNEASSALYLFRYGDTALLTAITPPETISFESTDLDSPAICAAGNERWK